MAQNQQNQYHPRIYSPPQSTSSPHTGAYLPPNKRQRLSPNPQAPYTSPITGNSSLPNQMFSSPNYMVQPNGHQQARPPVEAAPPPPLPPPAGTMGPPSRPPAEKLTDVHDLSDVLVGSGVDLREEEAALVNRFSQQRSQHGTNFTPDALASFNQQGLNGPLTGNFNPYSHFSSLSQNKTGDKGSFYGAGTFNQPSIPIQSAEARNEEERKQAILRIAQRAQYHLNDPFLDGACVTRNVHKLCQRSQVIIPRTGLLTSQNKSGQPSKCIVSGPDGNEVLMMLRGQDLIYPDAPLTGIVTLLSLAAQERIRSVVEDTAALAKGRRTGTHGVIPPEFADIAVGNGAPDPVTTLPTPGNSAVSPKSNSLKRPFSESNTLLTPVSDVGKTPADTIAFPNQLAVSLRKVAQTEREREEARNAKRARRTADDILPGEGSRSGSISTHGPGTPGTLGEQAPDISMKKAPSKKEQKRLAEAKASVAQQHADMNSTLNMAIGLGGNLFGGKQISWMSKAPTANSGGFPVQAKAKTKVANAADGKSKLGVIPGKTRIGDFREDKETGAGVQMRDIVMILEPDSKEKKALARAYSRLSSKP